MPLAAGSGPAADGIRVTVVVPVYNPGRDLDACIASIVGQSLAPGEYEAIFVDDGSTDDSPARLDELAATHPNVRVIHQPNSGWPGKPRNVGIDAARGRYVYFVDHDDWLGPEALERLYAFAERNGSDVVIGKMAGHGRGAPRMLFLETRDRVTIEDSGIIGALSPHKLFRTSFLDRHAIRFPEGRRRLEDQVFVLKAYFAADVISIYADYTCYYHFAPSDRANAASGLYDPAGHFDATYYYGFLREVLDVIEANTEPGPQRDRLLRRFVNIELLRRVGGRRFLTSDPDRRRQLLHEVESVVERYIPPSVDTLLSPHLRTRMALIRADRRDLLLELAKAEEAIRLAVRAVRLRRLDGRRLGLAVEAELVDGDGPLVYGQRGDHLLLPVPSGVAAAVPDEARSFPLPADGLAHVVLRRRLDSAEIILAAPGTRHQAQRPGGVRVVQAVEVEIDPDSPAEDFALRSGRWDVFVRVSLAGFTFDAPVRQPAGFGRSRLLALLDGGIARTRASWSFSTRLPTFLVASRLPRLVLAARASRPGRRLRRLLRG